MGRLGGGDVETPALRQTSSTVLPSSACRKMKAICCSLNRDLYTRYFSLPGGVLGASAFFALPIGPSRAGSWRGDALCRAARATEICPMPC